MINPPPSTCRIPIRRRHHRQRAVGGVRSTQPQTSGTAGKYYAEFDFPVAAKPFQVGIMASANTLTSTTQCFRVASADGAIDIYSVSSGVAIGAFATNDVVAVAWDTGARLLWVRRNAGNWNNNASADPATASADWIARRHRMRHMLSGRATPAFRGRLSIFAPNWPILRKLFHPGSRRGWARAARRQTSTSRLAHKRRSPLRKARSLP